MTEKTRCNGMWTEARFQSFVKGNLRAATRKWAPINICKKAAWLRRGWYRCADCNEEISTTIVVDGKRVKNVFVDHIDPIVDPAQGFVSWDTLIDRMFCEQENLQVLCKECHDRKTTTERDIATARRRKERELAGL